MPLNNNHDDFDDDEEREKNYKLTIRRLKRKKWQQI
jgi:hypothetical protein